MVPTPRGIMEKEIKSILNNATSTSDMKIKFCQMGSRKLASIAKSDSFVSKFCDRPQCTVQTKI